MLVSVDTCEFQISTYLTGWVVLLNGVSKVENKCRLLDVTLHVTKQRLADTLVMNCVVRV